MFALTKEFVEKLVKEPISDFTVSAGSAEGDNVAGELKAIKVTTAGGKVINLVHKTIPQDPHSKMFVVESGVFRTENDFYTVLAPKLIALAESRKLADASLPIPKFYGGFNNDSDDYISLEDLRPRGYAMPNKYVGLTLAETSLILKNLARFHALTYSFLRQEGEQFLDDHPTLKKNPWQEPDKKEEVGLMMKGVFNTSIELITKTDPELAKRMNESLGANCVKLIQQTSEATDVKYFPCIIHGDIWLNNILLKYDEAGVPTSLKFIDFQQTKRGNVMEDLQYFMYTSTSPAFRKEHLYTVLGEYHDSFVRTLKELDVPVPIGFSRGFLIDSFDECKIPAFVFMLFALPMQWGFKPNINFGPPQNADASGETPPPQAPPADFKFDKNSIPLEIRTAMFVGQLREMMEKSDRAIGRLLDLTHEMEDLKLF